MLSRYYKKQTLVRSRLQVHNSGHGDVKQGSCFDIFDDVGKHEERAKQIWGKKKEGEGEGWEAEPVVLQIHGTPCC